MFARFIATAVTVSILPCIASGKGAAQAASVTYVGTDCSAYTRYVVHGLPRIGTRFAVETVPSVGNSDVFVVTGLSDQLAGGVRLPFDISRIASNWCGSLRNSAEVWIWVRPNSAAPTTTYPFDVPNDARIAGLSIYQQVARVLRGASPGGEWSLSRGARLTMGY